MLLDKWIVGVLFDKWIVGSRLQMFGLHETGVDFGFAIIVVIVVIVVIVIVQELIQEGVLACDVWLLTLLLKIGYIGFLYA